MAVSVNIKEYRRLHKLIAIQKIRETERRLRSLHPRTKGAGVIRLMIETPDVGASGPKTVKEIVRKYELEEALMNEISRRS